MIDLNNTISFTGSPELEIAGSRDLLNKSKAVRY